MTATVDRSAGIDRFGTPLYTVHEAARYLDVPVSTLASWTRGRGRRSPGSRDGVEPLLASFAYTVHGAPSISFVGLAEGMVLAALRRSGAMPQRIHPVLTRLDQELGIDHAMASQRLHSDGPEILHDHGVRDPGSEVARAVDDLLVVRNGRRVFNVVVEAYLSRITFGPDGYASSIRLPAYEVADVVVDPTRGFGQPIFSEGGARLDDALAMFRAGEPLEVVAAEFGVSREHLEDTVRVATRTAA